MFRHPLILRIRPSQQILDSNPSENVLFVNPLRRLMATQPAPVAAVPPPYQPKSLIKMLSGARRFKQNTIHERDPSRLNPNSIKMTQLHMASHISRYLAGEESFDLSLFNFKKGLGARVEAPAIDDELGCDEEIEFDQSPDCPIELRTQIQFWNAMHEVHKIVHNTHLIEPELIRALVQAFLCVAGDEEEKNMARKDAAFLMVYVLECTLAKNQDRTNFLTRLLKNSISDQGVLSDAMSLFKPDDKPHAVFAANTAARAYSSELYCVFLSLIPATDNLNPILQRYKPQPPKNYKPQPPKSYKAQPPKTPNNPLMLLAHIASGEQLPKKRAAQQLSSDDRPAKKQRPNENRPKL